LALMTTAAVGCGSAETPAGTGGSGGHGGSTSSVSSTSSGSGSSSSGEGTSTSTGGLTCASGEGVVLAGTKLYFGDTPNGQWKKYGFNIDGLVSNASSKDVCQLNAGASGLGPYPDGDDGIDNSFGKNLLPQIISLYPNWANDVDNGLKAGTFTVLLKMECLPPTGDVPSFTTKLFGGTVLGMAPKFDGTDKWPVAPDLLSDPMDPESSTILFKNSSVVGNTYDSGSKETFILTVPINSKTMSTSIKLTLYSAHTTMVLSDDRKSALSGMIGGVLDTEEFVAEIKKVGYLLGICNTALLTNLENQIRQASDIMADGTQDPTKPCNGISMGLGFEMKEVQLGEVGPPTPVGKTCP
jgi:hypothetical protein